MQKSQVMRRFFEYMSHAFRERVVVPLSHLTWREVVVAVSVGILGGIFPVPFVTPFITLLVGYYIRCTTTEVVLASTINLFCTPLQLALLPSLARLAGFLLQADVETFTAHALHESLKVGKTVFLSSCGRMMLYATVGWLFVAIPTVIVLRSLQQCILHDHMHKEMTE
ncbi:hypothetical protein, conserved [Leishmania tarentolae]|uniref:DUF2062 domain-containing protein n=1 Tax=Leishmania tarentolae TaxID=5689 RepID=A0A640KNY1_LEITA|nr:hypothetical protein, conserved [Leishmania tarentolae]